jgi:AraC-like DNA-binding protein
MPAALIDMSARLDPAATQAAAARAHIAVRLDLRPVPGRMQRNEAFIEVMADESERTAPHDRSTAASPAAPHLRLATGATPAVAPPAPVAPEAAPQQDTADSAGGQAARPPLDERVARALEQMRSRPAERWTVAKLAKAAGLSRAAFARRFAAEVGVPPLRYLADLRLARAAQRLVEGNDSLAGVAAEVGYESEFAFSRAFKRRYGEAPGVWRRHARAAGIRPMAPRAAA